MATLTDIITRIQYLIGSDDHISSAEITSLAQTRYEHLYETIWWSRRERPYTISTVAQLSSTSSDLVTVTNGSATVTSAGTPFTSGLDGYQVQIGAEPQHFFVNYVSTSQITLEDGNGGAVTWPGATASDAAWRIFKTLYTLPTDADGILSLAHDAPLTEYDGGQTALDRADPDRSSTADAPYFWMYAGVNASGVKLVELWPVPSAARLLRGKYLRKAPTLSGADTIDISVPWFAFAVAADACGMLYAKTADAGWKDLELFYERKSQEVGKDILPVELERLSLPTSMGRHPRGRHRNVGTDYDVDHHLDAL